MGSAQSHLANEGVGVGDVFLFFGWFREVEQQQGRWRYARRALNIHSLFGWLQVGDPRFALKKNKIDSPHEIERAGDNIYHQGAAGAYAQVRNGHHKSADVSAASRPS